MSKANRKVIGWHESGRSRRMRERYESAIPRKDRTMAEDNLTELLARMWIECDPNRGDEPGSGYHPDDLAPLHVDGVEQMRPRWEWFVPRAEATLKYLAKHGLKIVPV